MIYDCFSFFNELDLLEIRLNVLNNVVDRFVLVEATKAHSGKDKPLYFNENKVRFKSFEQKIIHVVIDDYPACTSPWAYENHQRNAILRGLTLANPEDMVMISDLDEIPIPEMVSAYANTKEIILFQQKMYYYFINYLNVSSPEWLLGTKLLPYAYFLGDSKTLKYSYSEFLLPELNQGVTPTKIRFVENVKVVYRAGWHFSYLGGIQAIIKKIQSIAHQEFNTLENCNEEQLKRRIEHGDDLFGRGHKYFGVELDDTFPLYIRNNIQKYQHLIFNITPEYLRKSKKNRWIYSLRGKIFRFTLSCIPKLFYPVLIKIRNLLWFGSCSVPQPTIDIKKL